MVEGNTEQCASHNHADRKSAKAKMPDDPKPIKKVSDKLAKLMPIYLRKKKRFLKGKMCAVLKVVPAVDVHQMGFSESRLTVKD